MDLEFWALSGVDDSSTCWTWEAGKCEGYGVLRFNGRVDRAHRVAWTLARGAIPEGMCVLHRCDNPPCVNPAHLFLGTRTDNNEDKKRKGRSADVRGESNPNVKLTDEQVSEIRRLRTDGLTQQAIADRYGVTQTWVSKLTRQVRRAEF